MRLYYFLVLTRPANVVTAISDILAGVAIAGALSTPYGEWSLSPIVWLVLSTIGLYAGGIVFNDVFDLKIDQTERPERPIPSGKVSAKQASIFGATLLVFGIIFAAQVSIMCAVIATATAIAALVYDKYAKHHLVAGPLTMGLCRGLNLLLGMSIFSTGQLPELWMISFIPIVFIAAITLTSRGEVLGNNQLSITFALTLDVLVAGTLLALGWYGLMDFWTVAPFITLWLAMNFSAKLKAIVKNEPRYIMKAVKMGVISLIPLNASYVAGFSNWIAGLAVLLLLPVSLVLAKKFAVT